MNEDKKRRLRRYQTQRVIQRRWNEQVIKPARDCPFPEMILELQVYSPGHYRKFNGATRTARGNPCREYYNRACLKATLNRFSA